MESRDTHRQDVTANRPGIIRKNKIKHVYLLLRYYQWTELLRKRKQRRNFSRVYVQIQWMLNIECMIIPVITGYTGRVTEGLKNNLENIPGKL